MQPENFVHDQPAAQNSAGALGQALAPVCLAITVLLVLLPSLVYHWQFGAGTFPILSHDEQYYAVLAASTARGQSLTFNPYLGTEPDLAGRGSEAITFVPRYLAAVFIRGFGWGAGFTVLSAFSTTLIWILAYSLCRRLTGCRAWSITGACMLLLLPYAGVLLTYPAKWILSSFAGWPMAEGTMALNYARRFNPALSAPALLAFLLLHWQGSQSKQRVWQLAAGAVGGLLFYCYFFFGVFAAVFSTLWLVWQILRERSNARDAVQAWVLHMVMTVPFLYWALQSMQTFRAFTVESREPYLSLPHAAVVLASIAILVFFGNERRKEAVWLSALGLATLLANNQHVLTGKFIEPWHFDANVVAPLSSLLLACALARIPLARFGLRTAIAALALTLAVFGFAAASQASRAANLEWFPQANRLKPAFDLVEQNTARDAVILSSNSDEPYPSWLVYHTGRRAYVSQYMMLMPARDREEFRSRAMCVFWLRGEAGDRAVGNAVRDPWSILFIPEGSILAFHPKRFTPEIRANVLEKYRHFLADPAGCSSPDLRLDWLLEYPCARLDAARVNQAFEVLETHQSGGFRLLRVQRR